MIYLKCQKCGALYPMEHDKMENDDWLCQNREDGILIEISKKEYFKSVKTGFDYEDGPEQSHPVREDNYYIV